MSAATERSQGLPNLPPETKFMVVKRGGAIHQIVKCRIVNCNDLDCRRVWVTVGVVG